MLLINRLHSRQTWSHCPFSCARSWHCQWCHLLLSSFIPSTSTVLPFHSHTLHILFAAFHVTAHIPFGMFTNKYSHFVFFLKIVLPVMHFPTFSFCYSSVASIHNVEIIICLFKGYLGECKTQVMCIFLCHSISCCPLTDFLFLGVNKFTMWERVTKRQDMCFSYRFILYLIIYMHIGLLSCNCAERRYRNDNSEASVFFWQMFPWM